MPGAVEMRVHKSNVIGEVWIVVNNVGEVGEGFAAAVCEKTPFIGVDRREFASAAGFGEGVDAVLPAEMVSESHFGLADTNSGNSSCIQSTFSLGKWPVIIIFCGPSCLDSTQLRVIEPFLSVLQDILGKAPTKSKVALSADEHCEGDQSQQQSCVIPSASLCLRAWWCC